MILYLDTSALVKLYIEETGSRAVSAAVARTRYAATHLIAYVEMRSALARVGRMGRMTDKNLSHVKKTFEIDWNSINHILPDEAMIRRAGEHAEAFELRGYDALHLAAAESLLVASRTPVTFACYDARLSSAAQKLGMDAL
jgi:uncharacterized protein